MGAAALTLEVINVDVFFGVVTLFQAAEKVLAVYRFRQFLGLERRRKTQIGAITGAEVGGNLTNTTLVNQNTNAAIGLGTRACSEIGSIGKSDVCD